MIDLVDMRPFRTAAELEAVRDMAKADEHELVFPSFVLTKGSFPIGYVGVTPAVMIWIDRSKAKARDSIQAMQLWESHLKCTGNRGMLLPATDQSELLPFLPKLGYLTLGKLNLFVKGFI